MRKLNDAERARGEAVIAANMGLIKREARRFAQRSKIGFDELISEAMTAIIEADHYYDSARPWPPYAGVCMRRAMSRYALKQSTHESLSGEDDERAYYEQSPGENETLESLRQRLADMASRPELRAEYLTLLDQLEIHGVSV